MSQEVTLRSAERTLRLRLEKHAASRWRNSVPIAPISPEPDISIKAALMTPMSRAHEPTSGLGEVTDGEGMKAGFGTLFGERLEKVDENRVPIIALAMSPN